MAGAESTSAARLAYRTGSSRWTRGNPHTDPKLDLPANGLSLANSDER